ncbi:methyl-accepting chemotaxis protein [Inconstantimicrobium mannanitabidum]|uniref:Methyl-accepting chemotaxis protein n=1 Tax=Inconstantimicrobium mannanitabidum TaxID=1604901 RepID=A0ACB5RDJ6_9CLOT|nr:methyl-accepting chemotaxis protein [Clostridium sp. TW13]GKX67343.1 methyl-accepting chemotaxis protein [Clostridium sp. TW13]
MKLKKKFIMYFTIFAIVPLVISGIIVSTVVKNYNLNDAYKRLQEELNVSKSTMEGTLEMVKNVALDSQHDGMLVGYLSGDNKGMPITKAEFIDKYKSMMDKYKVFSNIVIISKNQLPIGDAINSGIENKPYTVPDYLNEAKETKTLVMGKVKKSMSTGNAIFPVAVPILDRQNTIQGYIVFSIDLQKLSQKYVTNIKIGESGYLFAIDSDGTTVMHPKQTEIFQKGILKTSVGNEILSKKTGSAEYVYNGVKKLVVYSADKNTGLIYLANIPESELTGISSIVMTVIFTISGVALILSVLLSMAIARALTNHINSVVKAMDNISEGDFTTKLSIKTKDEIGIMADKINETMEKLRFSVSGVKENSFSVNNMSSTLTSTSKEMAVAANEVAMAIEGISNGAVDQTRELLDVTSELEKFNGELDDIYNKVTNVNSSSKDAEGKAVIGKDYIESLTESIVKVKQFSAVVNNKINELGTTVGEIGKITDSINEISEQTNLLALNAAIEAARAGEQGKGFAVVADEVRQLAEQSSKASGEIMELINSVSRETEAVIGTSKQMGDLIGEQANVVDKTIESFDNILQSVQKITPMVDATYSSVENAIKAKAVVLKKIESIASVSEEVSASTEEISASAEEMLSSTEEVADIALKLNESVDDLISKVDGFKVE